MITIKGFIIIIAAVGITLASAFLLKNLPSTNQPKPIHIETSKQDSSSYWVKFNIHDVQESETGVQFLLPNLCSKCSKKNEWIKIKEEYWWGCRSCLKDPPDPISTKRE